MLKTQAILEVLKDDRDYQLHLPINSTLGEIHDVLLQMHGFILEKIQEHAKSLQPSEKVEPLETKEQQPK